jgi:branched-chain amino acid transport system substrate-binding protein
MRVLHRFAVTAAIGLLVLLGAGHRASAQIKIGAVLSVSGPASFLGDPEKKTLEIYVDEINAKGGVNGQKLQLVVYDDAGSADNARTFATRLVEEDKIVAMVGGSTTGATLAMIQVFEEAKIPFISLAGAVRTLFFPCTTSMSGSGCSILIPSSRRACTVFMQ